MKKQYEVRWTQTIERKMRKIVEADDTESAIDLAQIDGIGDEELSSLIVEEYNFVADDV